MRDQLGAFEELILLAVCNLRDGAYAVPVQQEIEREASRSATMGSVYATLDRLERKGLLKSRMGASTAKTGGKAKRFYEPTGTGLAALKAAREARSALVSRMAPDLQAKLGYGL